jgi:hypothetical protein
MRTAPRRRFTSRLLRYTSGVSDISSNSIEPLGASVESLL